MPASRSKSAAARTKSKPKVAPKKKEEGMLRRLLTRKAVKETAKVSVPSSPSLVANVSHLQEVHEEQARLLEETRAQLRVSEERYAAFVRYSTEGIWRLQTEHPIPVDLAEDEQIDAFFRLAFLVECNDTFAKMYGFASAAGMRGVKLSQFLVRDDPQNIDYLRAFMRSGYSLTGAESHRTDKDGGDHWFVHSLMGTVENGQLTGAWGVQRDITAQKKAEAEVHLLNAEFERKVEERARELMKN